MMQTTWQKIWQMLNGIAGLISMQVIISNQKTTEL